MLTTTGYRESDAAHAYFPPPEYMQCAYHNGPTVTRYFVPQARSPGRASYPIGSQQGHLRS
ncbi:hypothetical protein CY34DRAFT_814530 [Suillus luteus UH-Slu-Lm8-n1]|uniref:Uncharacterized protein n=1 Tax=Suillus luteus UH-Slu-Lm8-n1 TaxID=930992 RepID=A0A0D0A0P4_9AGAM|nr:hypothetical protein CY34DRAFT_814530 [Suillus luteus UH-Slu-Lm8-n1]